MILRPGTLIAPRHRKSGVTPLVTPIPQTDLAHDWILTAADVQSVANEVAGGAALQRGSTSGVDTNDPSAESTGWLFGGDDYGVANFAELAQPSTVIVVANITDTAHTQFLFDAADWSARNVMYAYNGGMTLYAGLEPAIPCSIGGWNAWVGVFNEANSKLFRGADLLATVNAGPFSLTGLTLGANWSGTQYQLINGTVARVLIYHADVSGIWATQIYPALQAWAATKGITI